MVNFTRLFHGTNLITTIKNNIMMFIIPLGTAIAIRKLDVNMKGLVFINYFNRGFNLEFYHLWVIIAAEFITVSKECVTGEALVR